MPRHITALALALIPLATSRAQSTPDPRYVRAVSTLYTTAQLGGLIKRWCDARAPETRVGTDSALAIWKSTNRLDVIELRAPVVLGSQLASLQSAVNTRRDDVFTKLDWESKSPANDCRNMLSYLNRSANPQRLHPFEMRIAFDESIVAANTPSTGGAPQPTPAPSGSTASVEAPPQTASTPAPVALPSATPGVGRSVAYTVAQLSALAVRNERDADTRLKRLGRIAVSGTLEAYGNDADATVWLNTRRDGWRSRRSVKCYDFSFRRQYDAGRRDVVIIGIVKEYDNWIVLEDCQLASTRSNYAASTLSDSGGLTRVDVALEQIQTPPNRGVTMAQIEGLYQPTALRYNAATLLYEPDETTYLVLKDGWAYDQLQFTPHDLNVSESRRLEPQHWHRWRKTGDVLMLQRYDEFGHTNGAWRGVKVIARPPIGDRRLNGVYSATAGVTVGGGGNTTTSTSTRTFTLRPNGTFQWSNFTRMYATSSNGTGDGGSSGAVGGVVFGPTGTSASSVGGGADEGTYSTSGYALELRSKSGKVLRLSIFSWDAAKYRDYLVIDGVTYSPPR
jgi:hypothetical protein